MNKVAILIICLLSGFSCASAQEENTIAVAIYNFTRYLDWPADEAPKEFYVDIIGHKSVYDKFKDISIGRKVGNRNIVVRYLESVDKITDSQILFVGFWQSKDLPKVVEKLKNAHTLIISEKEGLIESGSAINFVIRNSLIKFEIKKSNIVKYGLVISETLEEMGLKNN